MSNYETINQMSKAKSRMLLKHVFFASLVLSTKVVAVPGCGTAFTDMTMIGYDPDFIENLRDPDLVMFVLAHEVMHIVLKHGLRLQGRDARIYNIACDYTINWMLADSGFKLWSHCFQQRDFASMSNELEKSGLKLLPSKDPYVGMSSEQLAAHIVVDKNAKKSGGGGQGAPEPGGMPGDIRAPGNMDPEERAVMERKIDRIVAQAASMARMAGKLSASMERLVKGVLNPPVPWQQLLREFVVQGYRDEESWSHRDRRRMSVYLPSMTGTTMGEVVLIGDTSGSITDQVFAQIGVEVGEIMEVMKPERVRMIWADTRVAGEQVFERHEPIELHPKGGGGTDMRVPLKHVEKFDPVMVILITDGYTPWPRDEPPYPLIVLMTTDAQCPIGRVVRMEGQI